MTPPKLAMGPSTNFLAITQAGESFKDGSGNHLREVLREYYTQYAPALVIQTES